MNTRRTTRRLSLAVEALEDRTAPALLASTADPSLTLTSDSPTLSTSSADYETLALTQDQAGDPTLEVELVPMQLQSVQPTLLQDSAPSLSGPGEQPAPDAGSKLWTYYLNSRYTLQSQYVQRTTGFADGMGTILSGPAAIYQAPSFASAMVKPILGLANNGDTYTVLGFENGFVKVQHQGQTGWIHVNAFLKTKYIPPPPSGEDGGGDFGIGPPKG